MQLQLVRQKQTKKQKKQMEKGKETRREGKCENQLLKLKAECSRGWLNCCAAFWPFIFTKLVHYELVLIRLAVCSAPPCGQSPQQQSSRAAEQRCWQQFAKTFQLKQSSQSRTAASRRVCRIFGHKTESKAREKQGGKTEKTKQNRSWQSAVADWTAWTAWRAGNNEICLLTSWGGGQSSETRKQPKHDKKVKMIGQSRKSLGKAEREEDVVEGVRQKGKEKGAGKGKRKKKKKKKETEE